MRFDEECEYHFIEYECGKSRLEVVFSENCRILPNIDSRPFAPFVGRPHLLPPVHRALPTAAVFFSYTIAHAQTQSLSQTLLQIQQQIEE